MNQFLPFFLPLYFVVYFGIAFIAKSLIVAKRTGKNPLVLPKNDSAYGLIGRYFKFTLIFLFVYVMAYALWPQSHLYYLPIQTLQTLPVQYAGILVLAFALLWTIIAQLHMKDSWRIGIDTTTQTTLITTGLFGYSRNPIFLGMMLSLAGLFMVTPNVITLLCLIMGYVLMQIQIRLEEEFLTLQHGEAYTAYQQKVRRLI